MGPTLLIAVLALPTPAQLATAWTDLTAAAGAKLQTPDVGPTLSDWRELAGGRVVKWRLPAAGTETDRLVAMTFIDQPIESVWVGILDDRHASLITDLLELQLPSSTAERKILYQRIDLPFPISDRHWILAIENNAELFAMRAGTAWERTWRLHPRGEAALVELSAELRRDTADVLWPPEAEGGWLLLSVGWGTLVTYHLRTNIGGYIPRELVTRYAMSKMDEMLEQIDVLATRVPLHYLAGHESLRRPDGTTIDPLP